MVFVLPAKSEVGVLDPELSGEGEKIIMSDGDVVMWTPPPAKPVIPDWSEIKAIKKYFGRTGHQVWPAWLYHPKDEPRLVKNAQEAAVLGVCYREASVDERGRYGLKHVWDWKDDSPWRPQPYEGTMKFNPAKPGLGKNYIAAAPNPVIAQNALLEAMVPAVTAAVIAGLRGNGPAAPATVDPVQWDAFLQFQAWQKTQQAMEEVAAAIDTDGDAPQGEEAERAAWTERALAKGIKVDGRWSLDKLRAVVEKAA